MPIADLDRFEVTFLGPFKNGMKWADNTLYDNKSGIFHVVGLTKTNVHLIPVGGGQRDKISVSRKKVKFPIKRVKD